MVCSSIVGFIQICILISGIHQVGCFGITSLLRSIHKKKYITDTDSRSTLGYNLRKINNHVLFCDNRELTKVDEVSESCDVIAEVDKTPIREVEYGIKLVNAISEIKREDWNFLVSEKSSPFLEYDWIYALESSGCASTPEGW